MRFGLLLPSLASYNWWSSCHPAQFVSRCFGTAFCECYESSNRANSYLLVCHLRNRFPEQLQHFAFDHMNTQPPWSVAEPDLFNSSTRALDLLRMLKLVSRRDNIGYKYQDEDRKLLVLLKSLFRTEFGTSHERSSRSVISM